MIRATWRIPFKRRPVWISLGLEDLEPTSLLQVYMKPGAGASSHNSSSHNDKLGVDYLSHHHLPLNIGQDHHAFRNCPVPFGCPLSGPRSLVDGAGGGGRVARHEQLRSAAGRPRGGCGGARGAKRGRAQRGGVAGAVAHHAAAGDAQWLPTILDPFWDLINLKDIRGLPLALLDITGPDEHLQMGFSKQLQDSFHQRFSESSDNNFCLIKWGSLIIFVG